MPARDARARLRAVPRVDRVVAVGRLDDREVDLGSGDLRPVDASLPVRDVDARPAVDMSMRARVGGRAATTGRPNTPRSSTKAEATSDRGRGQHRRTQDERHRDTRQQQGRGAGAQERQPGTHDGRLLPRAPRAGALVGDGRVPGASCHRSGGADRPGRWSPRSRDRVACRDPRQRARVPGAAGMEGTDTDHDGGLGRPIDPALLALRASLPRKPAPVTLEGRARDAATDRPRQRTRPTVRGQRRPGA